MVMSDRVGHYSAISSDVYSVSMVQTLYIREYFNTLGVFREVNKESYTTFS
jgi:hypothetical protein